MTETQSDYTRTDELGEAIISLDVLRSYYGISRDTLERWIRADRIKVVQLPSSDGPGRERGVRIEDIRSIPAHKTRWQRRN